VEVYPAFAGDAVTIKYRVPDNRRKPLNF
jgi:hypothetical protein